MLKVKHSERLFSSFPSRLRMRRLTSVTPCFFRVVNISLSVMSISIPVITPLLWVSDLAKSVVTVHWSSRVIVFSFLA